MPVYYSKEQTGQGFLVPTVRTRPIQMMISKLLGMLFARLAPPLTSFVVLVLVARMWTKSALGEYSTVYGWFIIFHNFSLFGIREFISKEIGANPSIASKYLAHGLLFGLLSSVVCGVVMVAVAILFDYNDDVEHGIIMMVLALPAGAASFICISVFTAFQAIRLIAFTSILQSFLFLLLAVAIIFNGYGLIALVLCLVIAWAIGSVTNILIAHRYVAKVRLEVDWEFLRKLLAPIIAFGLTGLAGEIFLRADIVMLSKIKDMNAVALYTPAGKTLEMCLMLPLTFYVLILPIAARVLRNFQSRMPGQLESSVRQLFIFVLLEFGLVFLFAEFILSTVYGDAYAEAGGILRVLVVSLLFMTGEMTLVMCCQAGGYHKLAMLVAVARTTGKVVLSLILIPIWGPMGAALATLVSIGVSSVVLDHFVRRSLGGFRWVHMIKEPALVCMLVMLAILLLAGHLSVLYLGSLFIAGYSLLLFAVNRFSLERLWNVRL